MSQNVNNCKTLCNPQGYHDLQTGSFVCNNNAYLPSNEETKTMKQHTEFKNFNSNVIVGDEQTIANSQLCRKPSTSRAINSGGNKSNVAK